MGKNTLVIVPYKKGDGVILSFYQSKKEDDNTLSNQADQNQLNHSTSTERLPEFDVNGTALNDLHSILEN